MDKNSEDIEQYRSAYKKMLQQNTQLHAQVVYWKEFAQRADEKATKFNEFRTKSVNKALDELQLKIQELFDSNNTIDNVNFSKLMGFIAAARPLVLQPTPKKST